MNPILSLRLVQKLGGYQVRHTVGTPGKYSSAVRSSAIRSSDQLYQSARALHTEFDSRIPIAQLRGTCEQLAASWSACAVDLQQLKRSDRSRLQPITEPIALGMVELQNLLAL